MDGKRLQSKSAHFEAHTLGAIAILISRLITSRFEMMFKMDVLCGTLWYHMPLNHVQVDAAIQRLYHVST